MKLAIAAVLVLAGLVLIVLNARKLISDWPRLKPIHNVDVAWVKIYFGLTLVLAAWYIVGNPAKILSDRITPVMMNEDTAARNNNVRGR